jgi:nifR3 family TIM-barrel protein
MSKLNIEQLFENKLPLIVSPMAGITNLPYREILWEFGPDLIISEMVNCRALVEGNPVAYQLASFSKVEPVRSLQLFGSKPLDFANAIKIVTEKNMADHIDINFGCPVPKVTRNGAGSATPLKPELVQEILQAVKDNCDLPVSIKIRIGVDEDHITMFKVGEIAEELSIDFITLHCRTTKDYYGGTADWNAVTKLKQATNVPVVANGDIWDAEDAEQCIKTCSPSGLAIGRAILGNPWIIEEIKSYLIKRMVTHPHPPYLKRSIKKTGLDKKFQKLVYQKSFDETVGIMDKHLSNLISWFGSEEQAVKDFRKHLGYYLKDWQVDKTFKNQLLLIKKPGELFQKLADIAPSYKTTDSKKRGRTKAGSKIHVPYGWL